MSVCAAASRRFTRKLVSLWLCASLFTSSLMVWTPSQAIAGDDDLRANAAEAAELLQRFQGGGQNPLPPTATQDKLTPATTAIMDQLNAFHVRYINDGKQQDQGATLYDRMQKTLSEFAERWYDWSQDHSSALLALEPEIKQLAEAMDDVEGLAQRVEGYLNQSCTPLAPVPCVPAAERNMVLGDFIDFIYLPMRRLALIMMDHQVGEKSFLARVDELIAFTVVGDIFDHHPGAIGAFEQGLGGGLLRGLKVVGNVGEGSYRLEHDPVKQLERDVALVLAAPAAMTYIRALKWSALDSMISQVAVAKNLLGDREPIAIPRTCQSPENGSLPQEVPVTYLPLAVELEFPRLLMNHGLFTTYLRPEHFDLLGISEQLLTGNGVVPSKQLQSAQEQFNQAQKLIEDHIDYLTEIPWMSIEQGDMYGILPFEQLEKVDFALLGKYSAQDEPYFDDLDAFDYVYHHLQGPALAILEELKQPPAILSSLIDTHIYYGYIGAGAAQREKQLVEFGRPLPVEMAKYFKQMITLWTVPTENQGEQVGQAENEQFAGEGFTELQATLMARHQTSDLMSLLTPDVARELQQRMITFHFPPYYSSVNMKRLALEELLQGLYELQETLQRTHFATPAAIKDMDGQEREHYQDQKRAIFTILDFVRGDAQLRMPRSSGEREGPQAKRLKQWQWILSLLDPYSDMAQSNFFPHKAVSSELLKAAWPTLRKMHQFMVKKSIIVQEEVSEYDYIKGQIYHSGYRGKNPWAVLKLSYYLAQGEILANHHGLDSSFFPHFKIFVRKMGLHLPLEPFFSQKILSKKSDRMAVWISIQKILDAQNNFLFRTKVRANPEHHYYDLLQYVATTPVLTKDKFLEITRNLIGQGIRINFDSYLSRVDSYFDDVLFQSAEELQQIYLAQDVDEKQAMISRYMARYQIGNDYQAKRHFLQANFYSKYLIYQEIVRRAVQDRKRNLEKRIEETCLFRHDEIENYKRAFYSLATQQEVLAQQYNIKSLPSAVENKLHSQSGRDIKVLQHSLWMMLGIITGAVTAGAGCLLTAGLGCVALLGSATIFSAYHGASIMSQTVKQYRESAVFEQDMQLFQEIGMTDQGNIKTFHRGPQWIFIEGIMFLPLVNFFSKFVTTIGKAVIEGGRSLMQKEKILARLVVHANHSTGLHESKHVLGLASAKTDMIGSKEGAKDLFKQMFHRKAKIQGMGVDPTALRLTPVHNLGNLPSKEAMDQAVGESLELYFKGSLKKMRKAFARHGKLKILNRHQGRLAAHRQALSKSGKVGGWWRKMRIERLEKLVLIQNKLEHLLVNLDQAIIRGESIAQFVAKNLDDLIILKRLPIKLREIPHYLLFQGMPMTRGRVPLYESAVEGYMIRRIMTAYDNLLAEHVRQEATKILTGTNAVLLHSTYQFIQATFRQIYHQISPEQLAEGGAMAKQLINYQEGLAKRISIPIKIRHRHPELKDPKQLFSLLFRPKTHQQKALAEVIWNSNALEKLVQDEHLAKFAHHAFRELNDIKGKRLNNLDDLDLSFRLVRLITATARPAMIQ